MFETVRTKWIEALRSGKYKQGTCCLRSAGDRFCCLGVLCDVVDPTCWELTGGDVYMGPDSTATIGPHVRERIGWGGFLAADQTIELMRVNDDMLSSFDEIAYWIEENIPVTPDPTPATQPQDGENHD